jgi:hypothetical protein
VLAGLLTTIAVPNKGESVKNLLARGVFLLLGLSMSLSAGIQRAAAQGPAGVGAASVAQDSSHSLNPMKWVKKDSNSTDTSGNRSALEKKLTPNLQAQGILPASVSATDACIPFTVLEECLATLHASHALGIDLNCLRAVVTGVHTNADVSSCKVADGEKPLGLNKGIHQLKPDVNAKQAAKDAEQQAKDELKAAS